MKATELGGKIHFHEVLESTNEEAKRLARLGAAHGEAVIAGRQTAGKGRRGRAWSSLPGENLYLSVILRPDLPPTLAPRLTSVAALAVAEALSSLGVEARIKWPNDVEVRGRKVSGILTELSADPAAIHFVVLGIGVNLNGSLDDLPEAIRGRATILSRELGRPVTREEVVREILPRLEGWLARIEGGFEGIRSRLKELSSILSEEVRLVEPEREIEGIAWDIDEEGALCVRTEDGRFERFLTGDVTSLRRL